MISPSPWAIASADSTPHDNQQLGEVAVDIGEWRAPEGYPVAVSLVRVPWTVRRSSGPNDASSLTIPCLFFDPIAFPEPTESVADALLRWRDASRKDRVRWNLSKDVAWRPLQPYPVHPSDAWMFTRFVVEQVDEGLVAVGDANMARHALLKQVLESAPWMLQLSSAMLAQARADLGLSETTHTDAEVLQSARCGPARAGWLSGHPAERAVEPPKLWLDAGAYATLQDELASRELGSNALEMSAFIGGSKSLEGPGRADRDHSEWSKLLNRRCVGQALVPLMTPRDERDVDDDEWLLNWLSSGRAREDLRSCLGGSLPWFEFYWRTGANLDGLRSATSILQEPLARVPVIESSERWNPAKRTLHWALR